MLEVPDLSHLTPDEQNKILDVIKRQQDEDEKEKTMLRALQDQFEDYKTRIKANAEQSKAAVGVAEGNDPVCALCFKTKFAEGCGHVCSFCEVRFCSRCGGRITIKSDKTMWVCNLCRKQKEILTKTGAWYHKDSSKLEKFLTHTESLLGKENHSEPNLVNSSASSIQGKESPDLKATSDHSQHSATVSRSTVLQAVDGNQCGNNSSCNADTKMQRIVTVPNLQSVPPSHSGLAQSVSLIDVHSPKHANEKSTSRILMVSAPEIKPVNEEKPMKHSNEGRALNNEQDSVKHEVTEPLADVQTGSGSPTSKPPYDSYSHTPSPVMTNKEKTVNDGHAYSKRPKRYESPAHSRQRNRQHERMLTMHLERNGSIVSSEDDIRSTTDCSSYGDGEKDTSISDYEQAHQQRMASRSYYASDRLSSSDPFIDEFHTMPNPCDCANASNGLRRECDCSTLQDQLPVSWQPSTDGRFLLGHLTLCKGISNDSSIKRGAGALLGLKVVGGKRTPSGRLGAFITKVRKGSLADIIGHLKPGDEIISWNKYCLQDASFDEVYEIILESKTDSVVELIVSRPIRDIPRIPETRLHQTAESSSCSLDSDRRDFESYPSKPPLGKIQIKLCYDTKSEQLYVTALRAVDLAMREGGLPRNPYLKMYLLPDRSNSFKRRTKTAKKTLSPEWMQTFVYSDVRKDDLEAMALELTLWDFDRSLEANNKFMGEVIIDLGLVCMNDEPHWFHLMPLGRGMNQDYDDSNYPLTFPKSMSSNINLTEDSSGTTSKFSYTLDSSDDLYQAKSYRSVPKRRLPHLPTASSQSTLAVSEAETMNVQSSIAKEERKGMEQNSTQSPQSHEQTVQFETMSVDHTLQTFVGGVGPGQIIGRQALAMSSVGEIELAFQQRSGKFIVQVRRAYKLACRQGTRLIPVYYVKVYMMSGVHRIAKKKTKPSPRSLSPTFNENLMFESSQVGNTIQIIVWADYGRMDNKVFTGSSQICIDNLDLSNTIVGTYKLFPSSHIFDASSYGQRQDSYSSFGSSPFVQS